MIRIQWSGYYEQSQKHFAPRHAPPQMRHALSNENPAKQKHTYNNSPYTGRVQPSQISVLKIRARIIRKDIRQSCNDTAVQPTLSIFSANLKAYSIRLLILDSGATGSCLIRKNQRSKLLCQGPFKMKQKNNWLLYLGLNICQRWAKLHASVTALQITSYFFILIR
jgi:hypothetical protein